MGKRAEWSLPVGPRSFSKQETVILDTEYCFRFEALAQNAMCVSYYKYGLLVDAYPEKVDAIASLKQRLDYYMNGNPEKGIPPGNVEYLVDVRNFAMIEFMHPRHPNAHFKSSDSDGSPGRVAVNKELYGDGGVTFKNTDLAEEMDDAMREFLKPKGDK